MAAAAAPRQRFLVGPVPELQAGQAFKFRMMVRDREEECFVVRDRDRLVAYINLCRHIYVPLDYDDGEFFSSCGKYLLCRLHGAFYEPKNGECIAGPGDTVGRFLFWVPLEISEGLLYAFEPEEPID